MEDDLMWSVRVRNGLETLKHTVVLDTSVDHEGIELAIVNLGARSFDPLAAVKSLSDRGIKTIGHIGHKEKDVWSAGEKAGCTAVVSNGSLAKRLKAVLDSVTGDGR